MAITAKVYLVDVAKQPVGEIRRLGIPEDQLDSYSYIAGKIAEVFSSSSLITGEGSLALFWRDQEGDYIQFSCDEELLYAFDSIENDILKIYVTEQTKQKPFSSGENNPKRVHPFVVCDICEKDICGIRYKCVECTDYDLCSTCEEIGHHAEHMVLKIPTPEKDWRPFVMQPFHAFFKNFMKPEKSAKDGQQAFHAFFKNFMKPEKSAKDEQQAEDGNKQSKEEAGWKEFQKCFENFGDINLEFKVGKSDCPDSHFCGSWQRRKSGQGCKNHCPMSSEEKPSADTQQDKTSANVGAGGSPYSGKGVPMNEQPNNSKKNQPGDGMNEDWTVLQDDVQTDGTRQNEVEHEYIVPSDPKFAHELEQMMSMGFTNEGNWLSSLLKAKDGNISQVLDCMQINRESSQLASSGRLA